MDTNDATRPLRALAPAPAATATDGRPPAFEAALAAGLPLPDAGLQAVIGAFYEAAGGLVGWREACMALAGAFDLVAVQLLGVFRRNGRAVFSFEGGTMPPEVWVQYITRYHALNPRIPLGLALRGEDWLHDHHHFDDRFIANDRFFQELVLPYRGRYMSATKLIEDDEIVVFLGLHRPIDAQPLDAGEIARIDRVRPHLVRAIRIFLNVRGHMQQSRFGTAMLDLLPHAVLVVDETSALQYVNAPGRRLLDAGAPLVERAGFVSCTFAADDAALIRAIRDLGLGATVPSGPPQDRTVARLRAHGGREYLAFAMAARPDPTMHAFGEAPCAILLIHALQARVRIDPLVVSLAFDLTPAEASVAAALADGETLESIARERRVALATVRAQLRRVFDKLGVARQADVVRLLHNLPHFFARGAESG